MPLPSCPRNKFLTLTFLMGCKIYSRRSNNMTILHQGLEHLSLCFMMPSHFNKQCENSAEPPFSARSTSAPATRALHNTTPAATNHTFLISERNPWFSPCLLCLLKFKMSHVSVGRWATEVNLLTFARLHCFRQELGVHNLYFAFQQKGN